MRSKNYGESSMLKETISILLVEDEADQRQLIQEILESEGHRVKVTDNADDAIALIRETAFDVIFSDWKLKHSNGMQILEYVRQQSLPIGFVMATAHGTIENAVIAMQKGADDYLTKPFQRTQLLLGITKAYNATLLKKENRQLTQRLSQQERLEGIIGRSGCMQKVFQRLERVSSTDATVLITGESGTGKELAARALHRLSTRKEKKFIAINCGAIPESLAEAELFGSEKGAFTGASQKQIGKFEAADGGTIFLDEIGELTLPLQTKLLRFLQEGTVVRLGSTQEVHLDVRVLAATHRDLQEQVAEKAFREDLFYRLNVVPVRMPALRERKEDIPILLDHFLESFSNRHSVPKPKLSSKLLKSLLDYAWPGNVRELSNLVERYVVLGDEVELIQQLNGKAKDPVNFLIPEEGINWEAFEREILAQAIHRFQGNRTQAAKWLGLPYKAFLYRIEKYGLT